MFGGSGNEDPFREMDNMLRRVFNVDHFGQQFGSGRSGSFLSSMSRGAWLPPMNLVENPTQFVLTADAAGMKREDMEVNVKDNRVCVKGTRKDVEAALNVRGDASSPQQHVDDGRVYHLYERGFGGFERCITLPSRIREDSVAAQFNDGVLSVTMDKEDGGMSRGSPISIR